MMVKELLICKTSVHLSAPAGRQAGRQAGLELLYCVLRHRSSSWVHWSQSFSGQEPRKRQSERREEWGSLVPGVPSLCTGEESKALAPNSAHASTVREDPNLSESVKKALTQLLIWVKATCHAVVEKSLCVWLFPCSLYQHLGLKITN